MPDYAAAEWIGAHPTNQARGRNGHTVLVVVNHVMLGTLGSTKAAFATANNGASAHYGIGRDGTVVQYVAEANTAYTNGPIRDPAYAVVPWLREYQQRGISPNRVCVTIEWEGTHGGAKWEPVLWHGQELQTIRRGSIVRPFVPTERQYQAGLALIQDITARHSIPLDRAHIAQHADFDSVTRWFCPSPLWPQDRLLADLKASTTMSTPPPPTQAPPLVWDGVTVPVAVAARLQALGALRLPQCGKVLRAGLWTFAGLGQRQVVCCEGVVLVCLPENAVPWDVQKVALEEAIKIKRQLGV